MSRTISRVTGLKCANKISEPNKDDDTQSSISLFARKPKKNKTHKPIEKSKFNSLPSMFRKKVKSTSEEEPWNEQSRPFPSEEVNTSYQSTPSYSISPALNMVSRRAIISRSRDDLQHHLGITSKNFTGEDQWFSKEKLYKDHIAEVLEKWDNIDDEIWAKVIVLERNRRIAKAYARAPVLTVNGSDDGFDGFKIGVNGFENPMRDHKVTEFKSQIGAGCKLKMDDSGNILVKRVSKGNIYVKNTAEETAVSNDILKLPNGLLEMDKPFKLFDMKKFQQNVNREMKRQFPERNKLETQCISTIAFVKNEGEVLDSPIWIMLINIVALEMLGAKMPKPTGVKARGVPQFSTGTLKKNVHSGSSDEDPYSLTPSGSSGSSGKGLRDRSRDESGTRARDSDGYGPQNWAQHKGIPNDLSDDYVEDDIPAREKVPGRSRARLLKKAEEKRRNDDPYYCGFSARVPAFNNKKVPRERAASRDVVGRQRMLSPQRGNVTQLPGPSSNPFWWQSRLYPDSGIGDLSSGASASSPAMSNFRGNIGSQLRNGGMAFRTQELSSFHEGKKGRDHRNYFTSTARPSLFRQGWE